MSRVIEMANLEGSGLWDSGFSWGWGTGMYELILDRRDCVCMPYSGTGAPLAWMLTAMPLKQGMVAEDKGEYNGRERPRSLELIEGKTLPRAGSGRSDRLVGSEQKHFLQNCC